MHTNKSSQLWRLFLWLTSPLSRVARRWFGTSGVTTDPDTAEGREEMLERMEEEAKMFEERAHALEYLTVPFIQFAGLMNEYLKLCRRAEKAGLPWAYNNAQLPIDGGHRRYINEKLERIFGPKLEGTSTTRALAIPSRVVAICQTLVGAGHQAVVVGGALVLGRGFVDWDVATSAELTQVVALFEHSITSGLSHDAGSVVIRLDPLKVVIHHDPERAQQHS